MKKFSTYKHFLFVFFTLLAFSSCKAKSVESTKNSTLSNPIESETRLVLGTICTIQLYEKGTQALYDNLFDRLVQIEQIMSVNISTSDIARINLAAGIEAVTVSNDTFTVLKTALEYAELTNGAFNPAIGPLVNLWAIGSDTPHLPSQQEIDTAISLCNWREVQLTESTHPTVFLAQKGMALDLGGIAKGYAADEVAEILRDEGVERAIIDLGGNIYGLGEKENGDAWRVGIKNPFDSTSAPILRIDVKNKSVVTSGVYERFFERDNKRYHHLLNANTGYPADNGLMSVTIVTESSVIADVLSTAVFVMGKQKGMDFLQNIGQSGLCIDADKNIRSTEELKTSLTVLNTDFTLN